MKLTVLTCTDSRMIGASLGGGAMFGTSRATCPPPMTPRRRPCPPPPLLLHPVPLSGGAALHAHLQLKALPLTRQCPWSDPGAPHCDQVFLRCTLWMPLLAVYVRHVVICAFTAIPAGDSELVVSNDSLCRSVRAMFGSKATHCQHGFCRQGVLCSFVQLQCDALDGLRIVIL